ncbi:hypothetical protein KCP78_22075 [Salmonella enterica subsp. enterica]|nr:hypothetical protein KCP78_22075 [Salmonella enterica subsp. enterica]
MGIGFAGGLGVLVLAANGVKPVTIPFDVISIIMAVIAAILLCRLRAVWIICKPDGKLLQNPKYIITILAPIVTYL